MAMNLDKRFGFCSFHKSTLTVEGLMKSKFGSDPDISHRPSYRNQEHAFPVISNIPGLPVKHQLTEETIPEKPEPPPKKKQPKPTQELVGSSFSASSTPVPPLPPRKPSLIRQTNGHPRVSVFENVGSSRSEDAPPPIPQRTSVRVPKPIPRSTVTRQDENSHL